MTLTSGQVALEKLVVDIPDDVPYIIVGTCGIGKSFFIEKKTTRTEFPNGLEPEKPQSGDTGYVFTWQNTDQIPETLTLDIIGSGVRVFELKLDTAVEIATKRVWVPVV